MPRLLIIDDDDRLRPLLGIVLRRGGHHVAEARDGDEALRRCAVEPFDAALCDLIMPGREGLETIRELRRKYPTMPVIAMSGGMGIAGLDPLRIAALLGASQTLAKPFRIDQLLEALALVLSAAPAEPRKALPATIALEA
jgi:CheY-like chemotaxis protein